MTFSSVLVPALVALVVSLSTEYFAKPSLEARKERILDERRQHRSVMEQYRAVASRIIMLSTIAEHRKRYPNTGKLEAAMHAALRAEVDALLKVMTGAANGHLRLLQTGVYQFAAAVSAFEDRHDSGEDQETIDRVLLEGIVPLLNLMSDAVQIRRWRRRQRERMQARIQAVFES